VFIERSEKEKQYLKRKGLVCLSLGFPLCLITMKIKKKTSPLFFDLYKDCHFIDISQKKFHERN